MGEHRDFVWGRFPEGIEVTITDPETGSMVAGQSIILTWKDLHEMAAVASIFGPYRVR